MIEFDSLNPRPAWAIKGAYEKFSKEYQDKEKNGKSCYGCVYHGTMDGMCGLASSACVNSLTRPNYTSKEKEKIMLAIVAEKGQILEEDTSNGHKKV